MPRHPRVAAFALPYAEVVFSIVVHRSFRAGHALRFPDGTAEPMHEHDWQVRVAVARIDGGLDDLECVVDFHDVERQLDAVLDAWQNKRLNDLPPFDAAVNPTAERVAERIGFDLQLAADLRLLRVEVTEAADCVAVYEPSGQSTSTAFG